jgi:hypothetical protein
VRLDVENFATLALSVPVPKVAVPSLNVTVPVGTPLVADFTVAVKVIAVPKTAGFIEEATELVLAALVTVCVSTAEVLLLKFASPP